MAWTHFPVSVGSPDRDVEYNELIDACAERGIMPGGGVPVDYYVSAGDPIRDNHINDLRSWIESYGVGYYRDPTAGGEGNVWTKATLLTAALSQVEWTDGATVGTTDSIRAVHFNEIQLVLDKCAWSRQDETFVVASEELKTGQGLDVGGDYNVAWAAAKTAYAGAGWGVLGVPFDGEAEVHTQTWWFGGARAQIDHFRVSDASITVAKADCEVANAVQFNPTGISGAAARVRTSSLLNANDYDLYQQANFGGAAIDVLQGIGQIHYLAIVATPNDTDVLHWSIRTDPDTLSAADLEDYRPAADPGSYRPYASFVSAAERGLILGLTFAHQT